MEGEIPKVYVLFQFTDKPPGIAKLPAVYKPKLPEDHSDAVTLLESWIVAKRQLVVRWPKNHDSSWNLTTYNRNVPVDSEFRNAIPLLYSMDKEDIAKKRDTFLKQSHDAGLAVPNEDHHLKKETRRKLDFSSEKPLGAAKRQMSSDSSELLDPDEEIQTLRSKVQKLEEEREGLLNQQQSKEVEELKAKVQDLEEYLDRLARDLATKENENMDLQEKIQQLEQQSSVVLSASELQKSISSLQEAMKSASCPLTPPQTPSSSRPSSRCSRPYATEELVPLGKPKKGRAPPLEIKAGALREAIIAGSVGPNQQQLNACVAALLRGFFSDEELAGMSLSGRKCPTMPNNPAKEKLPVEIRTAITDYILDRWNHWHKVTPEQKHINSAFTARLGGAHQSQKKKTNLINKNQANQKMDEDEASLLLGRRPSGGRRAATGGSLPDSDDDGVQPIIEDGQKDHSGQNQGVILHPEAY